MKWKYIEGYDNRYKIYKNGDVFNGDQKLEPYIHKTVGIYFVNLLANNGYSKSHAIARLVYETFVDKIKDGTKLKYLDDNKHNYHLDNLTVMIRYSRIHPEEPIELDKTKKWKPIRGYEEFYKISEYGDIYSVRLNKMIIPNKCKGYYSTGVKKDKIRKKKFIHTLVYISFKNKDVEEGKVIDHIDRNKTNNHIDNLREVTPSINSQNVGKKIQNFEKIMQYTKTQELIKEWYSIKEVIKANPNYSKDYIIHCCVGSKKSAYGFVWKYKDYIYKPKNFYEIKTDDERTYSNYKINKEGIIINQSGKRMRYTINDYYYVSLISDCGKNKSFYVHRLIALTFILNPNNKPMVNHIDENKLNNSIENLEWATCKENNNHSNAKKVQQIDIKTGNIINTYNSITLAFESLERKNNKGAPWGIGKVCAGNAATAFGYKWKFVD